MSIKTISDLLAEHPFFEGLTANHIEYIAGCGSNVRFDAGDDLGREGAAADKFYIIRSGRIAIETYVPDEGPVQVQTLSAGDVVGWSWIVPPYRWMFDARALETTMVVSLDGKCLRGKCEEDPRLGYELMKSFAGDLAMRFQTARIQLLNLYGRGGK